MRVKGGQLEGPEKKNKKVDFLFILYYYLMVA